MRYKRISFLAVVLALVVSVAAMVVTSDNKEARYHQHLEAQDKPVCTCGKNNCTHLPLISIDTGGEEIPGTAVLNKGGDIVGRLQSDDGESTVASTVKTFDNASKYNHTTDTPTLESTARVRVRGNSSRAFDKVGYYVKLVNSDGTGNEQSMLGMDAHSEWALHGPYMDKTLIRNYMWYNIGGEIMDYAPNVRFCELVLNGEYMGVYLLVETITAGTNCRLNLEVDKKDNSFTGYCLRVDRGSDNPLKNVDVFSSYAYKRFLATDVIFPGAKSLSPEMNKKIGQEFSDFEKALYSYDYDDKKYGYAKYIDVQSFVDYYIINEFTTNYDAGRFSTYVYKDVDGKYRLCIWDFNSACDNYETSVVDPHHFEIQYSVWFNMLIKDPAFTEAVIQRYKTLRKGVLSEAYLDNYIDETVAYLGPAIDRNNKKWGYSYAQKYDLLEPTERNPRSYDEAVGDLKYFINRRGDFMDENIETLRQYSAESATKKYEENAN